MKEKDFVLWIVVILGLVVNGFANLVILLFEKMLSEDVRLSNGIFVGILLVCVYVGLVDKGLEYFECM